MAEGLDKAKDKALSVSEMCELCEGWSPVSVVTGVGGGEGEPGDGQGDIAASGRDLSPNQTQPECGRHCY